MAINLPLIAQTFYNGTASPYPADNDIPLPSPGLVSYPYSVWPDTLKATYDYNPTKAKQFLTAAGYPSGFIRLFVALQWPTVLLI